MKELILPWPSKDLSPNGRAHWARKVAAAAKSARALGIDNKRFVSHPCVQDIPRKGGEVVFWITGAQS